MYAIIDTGNQQEKVEVGSVIEVDYMADKKKGDKVKFEKVLLITDGKTPKIGTPHVAKAFVSGEVVSQDKKDKVFGIDLGVINANNNVTPYIGGSLYWKLSFNKK